MTTRLQQHLAPSPSGISAGLYSVCSAHPLVLRAAAEQAVTDGSLLLIEATSNQVNQDGGYTGMQPEAFRAFVEAIVQRAGLPASNLILGGDHLGPNPWRHLSSAAAMQRAQAMVSAYSSAGFSKIHLDASMACQDDPSSLSDDAIAARSVALCQAAERAHLDGAEPPVYVIGTEVPTPGGATHELRGGVAVTSAEAAAHTLEVHHRAFLAAGLEDAWSRVVALVVQPGVEFDHDSVVDYDRAKAASLIAWRRQAAGGIVFEAHSTDYQLPDAYSALVEDGFAILKVGPALTFALREGLDALSAIESQLVPPSQSSNLRTTIERTMLALPASWAPYYSGDTHQQALLRQYSYSDRVRYYWHTPEVASAVQTLLANLSALQIPNSMLSLHLPAQYARLRKREITGTPESLLIDKVRDVLRVYAAAC